MEASRFGFGADVAPAYKFDPTDADIVARYLLPRALNLPNHHEHAIIEDDPASLLPWELLQKHGHGDSDHAFFFGPPGRRSRAVNGGTWQGQKGGKTVLTLVRGPGGDAELDIVYKRYNLAFCNGKRSNSTGFVMHEYQIVSPPLSDTVLTRIRVTDRAKEHIEKLQRKQAEMEAQDAAGDQQLDFPVPEQPAEADAQMVVPNTEQPGPSYRYHPAVTVDGEGSSGGQTYALYDGDGSGMVATDGYYAYPLYDAPEGGGECSDYCQYQSVLPFQDQLDPSYQYHAGNAAVMCDGEGFSGGQTGNGGGMGETAGGYDSALLHSSWECGGDNDGEANQELDCGQGSG